MQEEKGREETERTWKPTAAGILCIIVGIIDLFYAVPVIAIIFGNMFTLHVTPRFSPLILIPLILLVFGIIPIVGGIYALRRRRWKLALAGSICCFLSALSLLGLYFLIVGVLAYPDTPESGVTIPMILGFIVVFVIFGILPYVFVVLGKGEFKAKALVAYERGDAYDETREYDKAITSYSKAIELDPNHALSYYNRGCAYGEMHEYEKAIADFNKTIELDPNDANAYYNRGLAYHEKGETPKAVSDLEKCIELSTDPGLIKDAKQVLFEMGHSSRG